jgi:hypothetical protein
MPAHSCIIAHKFLLIAIKLKNDILLAQPVDHHPDNAPEMLPQSVTTLLSQICNIPEDLVGEYWDELREAVWCTDDSGVVRDQDVEALFQKHGYDLGFRECDQNMKCVPLQYSKIYLQLLHTLSIHLNKFAWILAVAGGTEAYICKMLNHIKQSCSLSMRVQFQSGSCICTVKVHNNLIILAHL